MGNMAVTSTVADADLHLIRSALQGLLATHRGNSRRALDAIARGREAYRLCFTPDGRQRVLDAATRLQREAPVGHYIHRVPALSSFEQVLAELGTQFVEQVLSGASDEDLQRQPVAVAVAQSDQ